MNARRGFSLVELLVVIALITMLISMLLPSLARAKKFARDVECLSQQRQLMNAVISFSNDHNTKLPIGQRSWPHFSMLDLYEDELRSYLGGNLDVLRCPLDTDVGGIARWWQSWYGQPMSASDHVALLPHEDAQVNFSYYYYVKMYWGVDRTSGILTGHDLTQYNIETVVHPSELFVSRCFVRHDNEPGFTGLQVAFIDAHTEWAPKDRIKKSCAPWYGDYNLDWTCQGIYGKDFK